MGSASLAASAKFSNMAAMVELNESNGQPSFIALRLGALMPEFPECGRWFAENAVADRKHLPLRRGTYSVALRRRQRFKPARAPPVPAGNSPVDQRLQLADLPAAFASNLASSVRSCWRSPSICTARNAVMAAASRASGS